MTTKRSIHGPALAVIRDAYGIQQTALAAAMGISGAYLANIEAGRRRGSVKLARAAAEHIGIDLAAITTPVVITPDKAQLAEVAA